MTGRRLPPRRDVILAARSPAVPTRPGAPGGQMPALFLAVADYLAAGVGAAPSASPSMPARPREPVYCSPRGRTHHFLRARGLSFRRRHPPHPPPSGQARPRPQLPIPAAQSRPLQLPPPPPESASSQHPPPAAPAHYAPPISPSRPLLSAPGLAPSQQTPPRRSPLACRVMSFPFCCSPAGCCRFPAPRRPALPLVPQHQPVNGLSRDYWNDDEVPGTPRDPDVDCRGVSWPHLPREENWNWRTPPPSPPCGEPQPGDGAYQARGMRLSEVDRCVTELSFVLDLQHVALQSREVDPLLDDGPGTAAFCMVATAAEESTLGIVPAIACVLRWLGWRVAAPEGAATGDGKRGGGRCTCPRCAASGDGAWPGRGRDRVEEGPKGAATGPQVAATGPLEAATGPIGAATGPVGSATGPIEAATGL
ncbi:unnamed protein product [Closterium sp. NIES-65]|nr:unnamed protein product [Closterium sp. NIES-65]